jgi:cell division GTPase FtsZ
MTRTAKLVDDLIGWAQSSEYPGDAHSQAKLAEARKALEAHIEQATRALQRISGLSDVQMQDGDAARKIAEDALRQLAEL